MYLMHTGLRLNLVLLSQFITKYFQNRGNYIYEISHKESLIFMHS